MADFEYVDVNGRQIRVRPRETAQEIDEYGNFHRQPNRFTEGFGEGKNPVEKDRYILFWAKGCNWSNRAAIARELLGLEDAVKVEIVDWTDREENLGWEFVNSPDHINSENQRYLFGDRLTESDVRLYVTLVRFDCAYYPVFRLNKKLLRDYPNLWAYARDLYQTPGFGDTTNFAAIKKHYHIDCCPSNEFAIVPNGPDESLWLTPHGRENYPENKESGE